MKHSALTLAFGAWSLALTTLSCGSSSTTEIVPAPGPNTACTGVSFPRVPAGASSIVYVAKNCPAEGADGTLEHPYTSIQQGLNKSDKGGSVMVAPGTYDESVSVHQGAAIYGSDGDSSDTAGVTIESSSPYGVTVDSGDGEVILQGLKVSKPIGAGIWVVSGNTSILASQVVGAQPTSDQKFGYGILATGGKLTLAKSTIDGATLAGVVVQNAEASISDSRLLNNGAGGIHLETSLGNAQILNNTFENNTLTGVLVLSGQATIQGNTITGSKPNTVGIADGIIVGSVSGGMGASHVQIQGNKVTNCGRVGLLFSDNVEGEVNGNELTDNASAAPFGAGLWLQAGAGAVNPIKITGNTISRNRFIGVALTSQAKGDIHDNMEISETVAASAFIGAQMGLVGDGVSLFEGAAATVQNNTIRKNGRFGLIADQASPTGSSITNNQISDNLDTGLVVQNDSSKASFLGTNDFSGNQMMDQHVLTAQEKPYFVKSDPFVEQ